MFDCVILNMMSSVFQMEKACEFVLLFCFIQSGILAINKLGRVNWNYVECQIHSAIWTTLSIKLFCFRQRNQVELW